MTETRYPQTWTRIFPGARLPLDGEIVVLLPETPRYDCENCKSEGGNIRGWQFDRNGPALMYFNYEGGARQFMGELITAPCPVCQDSARSDWLLANSGLDGMFIGDIPAADIRLDTYPPKPDQAKAYEKAGVILSEIPKLETWLLLTGNNGVGKTHLLVAMVNAVRVAGYYARYETSENIIRRLRNTIEDKGGPTSDDIRRDLEFVPALVIDELDSVKWSQWAGSELFAIINNRYKSHRATWAATNKTATELEIMGQEQKSILSRFGEGFVVPVTGKDLRLV